MKSITKLSIFSLFAVFTIVGCGGGGKISSKNTEMTLNKGYYIDSAVIGIEYDCETYSGTTNSKGEFKFESGHKCSFKIDDIKLREVPANKLKNSIYILEDNPKVAAILQTVDSDGNASNGIDISSATPKCLNDDINSVDLNRLYNCLDSNDTNYNGKVVTEAEAIAHVNATREANRPIAHDSLVTILEDTPTQITLDATDPQGDSLTSIITVQPKHGTISGTGINLTYTPDANYSGSDSFKFKVSDGSFESNESTVTITVTATSDTPVAKNQSVTLDEDSNKSITLTSNDAENSSLNYIITQNPSHGTLRGTLPNIIYTPDTNYNGSDSFKFKVNDGNSDSNEATVNITINPVNDVPTATNDNISLNEDGTILIAVLSNDNDIDGDTLSIASVNTPNHGSASIEGKQIRYTPNANYNGSDVFTYTISDGHGGSDTAEVNITINAVNDAPVASSQSVTLDEDSNKSITLTGSDIEGNSLSYTITQEPEHGSIGGTLPNIIYIPNANYNGTDSFKFKVNDGHLDSNEATVNITVNPVNDAPTANNISTSTIENKSKNITLDGRDIDSSNLSYTIVQNPSHGTVSISGSVVTYTPNNGYRGDDSFTYKAYDGNLYSNVAIVSIQILKDDDIHIDRSYKVVPLGSGITINKKVYLDSSAKNLYLVFSNKA